MKQKSYKLEKFSLSFWSNTTHVSLVKVGFTKEAMEIMKDAINSIIEKKSQRNNFPTYVVPFNKFPMLIPGVQRFNKKGIADFFILYYDHNPIGKIYEDIPRVRYECPICGCIAKKVVRPVKFGMTKKLIKKLFKDIATSYPIIEWYCPAGCDKPIEKPIIKIY